jgi:deoxyribonuclease-4
MNAGLAIGAHVPGTDPVGEGRARNADLVQIFLSNPQSWHKPPPREDAGSLRASPIPIYVHAPYLINVVAEASRIRIPSRRILQETCDAAADIGAAAVVVHGGHVTGEGSLDDAYPRWRKALTELDSQVRVLIENTAGGEQATLRTFDGLARLWAEVGDLGCGIVLDTCHAWAGGEPLQGLVEMVLAITGKIDLVHCNDSRDPFDSRRDRHANLEHGHIPPADILAVVAGAGAPVVVETPGEDAEHRADITWLRAKLADASLESHVSSRET